MQDNNTPDQDKPDLFRQVYQHPKARQLMDRVQIRAEQLMALAAELDEAVCDEKPVAELRETISAVEYIAADLQVIGVRHEVIRSKWTL